MLEKCFENFCLFLAIIPQTVMLSLYVSKTLVPGQAITFWWNKKHLLGSGWVMYRQPEPEKWDFRHHLWGSADVNASENHVWSLLLHKNILSKMLENASKSAVFSSPFCHRLSCYLCTFQKHCFQGKRYRYFDETKNFTFASVHVFNADVRFCDDRGMLISKTTWQFYNSIWISLLRHGCYYCTSLVVYTMGVLGQPTPKGPPHPTGGPSALAPPHCRQVSST